MNLETLIGAGFATSIFLTVLAVGMAVKREDLRYVLGQPGRLARALLAINVLVPVATVVVCKTFSLHPAVIVALVTLSVAPVSALFAHAMLPLVVPGRMSGANGLFFASTLLAVIVTPLAVEGVQLFASGDGEAVHVSPLAVAQVVFGSVLLPLFAGFAIARRSPGAKAWAPVMQKLGSILLVACAIPVLIGAWPHLLPLVREGTLTAIALITLVALAAGHLLGGPNEDDRTVLAFACVSRHPGVAMAIAALTGEPLAPLGVLLAVLVSEVAVTPYKIWRKRVRTAAAAAGRNPPAAGAH